MDPTILIVDDDAVLVRAMRALLEHAGYHVMDAGSIAEARAAVERRRPDLVIMDLVLPGLEGREGANLIVAHHPGLRVLYMSGYTNQETLRIGDVSSGQPFLRKPFGVEDLLGAIERVLEGREWDEASEA